jgi:serine/threonine protein kinase/multidrug efflux pump subunit AcrA (membrane-fusion protein)
MSARRLLTEKGSTMAQGTFDHPDPDRLAAFGRGRLDHDEMTEVESHLAVCESCCQLLSTLPDEEFVGLLRAAQERSESTAGPRRDANQTASTPISSDVLDTQVPPSSVLDESGASSNAWSTLAPNPQSVCESPEVSSEQGLSPELANHPRYRVVQRLGRGGMGTVYLAEHRLMDRQVALKVIRHDLLENEGLVERFRREVKAAARLGLHPNIVAAYDAEQAGDSHFLVMEYVDGVDLARLIKSQGPLSCDLACAAVKQAAEGLEHAYQRGMVHRDIKPQNLMRTPGGQVKILDFGLARFASEALTDLVPADERVTGPGAAVRSTDALASITLTDMVLGTADYIAPEQASAPRSADIRADIYSLGCTLYYLLTGQTPFPDGTPVEKIQAHRDQAPRSLTEARPDVPPELAQVVDRMMAKDRGQRFQTPAEVAEVLAPFASSRDLSEPASEFEPVRSRTVPTDAAPSPAAETMVGRLLHQPTHRLAFVRRRPGVIVALILAALTGCVAFIWREAPGLYVAGWPVQAWSVAAHLALLLGCLAFLGIGAAGWPGAARLALLIGSLGLIRMQLPGLVTAALLALCEGCATALGITTLRQAVYALLALLAGIVVFFLGAGAGITAAAEIGPLMGFVGAVGIIAYRQSTARAWGFLSVSLACVAAAVVLAWNYRVPTMVSGEGILLIDNELPSLVRAPASGKLVTVKVAEGDVVAAGQVIGQISQEDLANSVRQTASDLELLRKGDQEIIETEERERRNEEAAIARLKQAIARSPAGSPESLKVANQLRGLEQDQVSAEGSRRRAQLEFRVKMQSMETKLALDREKLERSSRIVSQVRGRVDAIYAAGGEMVGEGAPLVLLHSPRPEPSAGQSDEPAYDAVIFVAAAEGDGIDVLNFVEVVPATVRREREGYIHGRVEAIKPLWASKWTMEEALGRPELADAFLKRHPPGNLLRVLVKFAEAPDSGEGSAHVLRANRFVWSSARGSMKPLKSGTPCQAAIVVKQRRLITLTLPWTRRIVGVE